MERKIIKYAIIAIIFFIGLSMGVSYKENETTFKQQQLEDFEEEIVIPGNDWVPVNPYDDDENNLDIEHNFFTMLSKDGEHLIRGFFNLIFDKSDDFVRVIVGSK